MSHFVPPTQVRDARTCYLKPVAVTAHHIKILIPKTLLQFWLTGCQSDARAGLKKQKSQWSLQNVPLCCHPTIPTPWWNLGNTVSDARHLIIVPSNFIWIQMEDTLLVLDFVDFDDVWKGPFLHETQNLRSIFSFHADILSCSIGGTCCQDYLWSERFSLRPPAGRQIYQTTINGGKKVALTLHWCWKGLKNTKGWVDNISVTCHLQKKKIFYIKISCRLWQELFTLWCVSEVRQQNSALLYHCNRKQLSQQTNKYNK